jgi:hypothetical protein
MKKALVACAVSLFTAAAFSQPVQETNDNVHLFHAKGWARPGGGGGQNLAYNGGPVIRSASVVAIFWGPTWKTSDATIASTIQNFFGQFGTSGEYKTITQYYDGTGNIQASNLGTTAFFDTSTPPTNVTDSAVQAEVAKYLGNSNGDPNTIYEVFLPASSYASSGSSTSCGGPNLKFCAYHGHFKRNGVDLKYASMPYPSCGGCQNSGWSVAQDFTMFCSHETREAVTDPDLNAWYDHRGYEADDKCAWQSLFVDNGYGYQPEWSNAVGGCVATTP